MANKVQICNVALNKLGIDSIVSLLENTKAATQCNLIYDRVVEQVISECAWSNATFRTSLAQLADAPSYGYSYQYQLPTNPKVLRVLEINQSRPDDYAYSIEDTKLLTDLSTISIKYIGLISNAESYGPYITTCVEAKLAAELAYNMTGDRAIMQVMNEIYARELRDKMTLDGLQGSSEIIYSTTLEDVR